MAYAGDRGGRLPGACAAGGEALPVRGIDMRIGQNPAKFVDHVGKPKNITVALVTYIPFLGGYYSESLDVLKTCLNSILENSDLPFDLMVFDNASCAEVRTFLTDAQRNRRIQYLVLSDKNVGKGGAWNFIFSAAPGEYVAYADSDVYFFPGWLSNQIALFETFPNLGMVTGAPLRIPQEFSSCTIEWAQSNPEAELVRGRLLSWEDYWRHARSLGIETEEEGKALYEANEDVILVYQGKQFFIGAGHFQFVARRQVLQSVLPIPSDRPMGQVRSLDVAINELGYLRLSTPEWWVLHLGNSLETVEKKHIPRNRASTGMQKRLSNIPIIRRSLLWLYNQIFRLYFGGK
jgi:glycosyltransferase involved in cell wall biosynthesis